jgi:hypothetical protein
MKSAEVYVDLDGEVISLSELDREERALVSRLRGRAATNPSWDDFDNYAYAAMRAFYDTRGVPRSHRRNKVVFKVVQDLSARLGIAQGMIRPPDYLGQLEDLVLNRFPSRRAFCEATGISQTMLGHVLAGRKDLSLESLSKALERIGYRLRIVPAPKAKRTG